MSGDAGPGAAPVTVDAVTWEGFDALRLSNGLVSVTVVPAMGGHVASLLDVAAGREWLWRNPRLTPRLAPYGAWFDDWWSGGWDEIFPSGDASTLRGDRLPYMGELWCLPWSVTSVDVAADGSSAAVTISVDGNIAAARFTRVFTLRAGEPVLRVAYRIESLDVLELPFTWGIHPAFAVHGGERIDHTASVMRVGVSSSPSMGTEGSSYTWPSVLGASSPVSVVQPREAGVFGGHWATDLREGWLALTDPVARRGIGYVFDRAVFPHAWLWQVYGGFRGHHHLALEAWTSMPMDLEGALAAGTARTLAPGAVLETDVAWILYAGLEAVTAVERAGEEFTVR